MLYKKIDVTSGDSIPMGLDLFGIPSTEVAVERTYERELLLQNPVTHTPHIFKVATGTSFMDPTKTRLVTQWRMWKKSKTVPAAQWEPIAEKDNISTINGLGAAWIRNIQIRSGGQTTYHSNNLYHYKAIIENELSFSEDAKKSSMGMFNYFYEPYGKTDIVRMVAGDSWKDRREPFVGGNIVEFSSPIYADIFQQPHFLLSHLEFDVEIYPMETKFMLYSPEYTVPAVDDGAETPVASLSTTRKSFRSVENFLFRRDLA
jgi:hypothetical protein